jgi:hypothetical protein
MAKLNCNTTPRPAWSGAIARARHLPATGRGRAPSGKAVGAFVPALTRKAFEKYGFSTASLIMDWPRIAGTEIAAWTTPEQVKWPRGVETADPAETNGPQSGATLVLRVDRAIEGLRLIQAPLSANAKAGAANEPRRQPVAVPPSAHGDDALGNALARMQAGIAATTAGR